MDLMLSFKKKPSVTSSYTGQTEFMVRKKGQIAMQIKVVIIQYSLQLGNLAVGASKEVELTVCPVKLGLITLTDLLLKETFSKNEYKFEDFLQVFVVDNFKNSELFEMDKNVKYAVS